MYILLVDLIYVGLLLFGSYLFLSNLNRRRVRQLVKCVWCFGVKLPIAILLLPVLVVMFIVSADAFLVVFTALWPHLDVLGEDGSLYLRRFFMTPKTKWFRPRFLHLIMRSDSGRDPHSHPGPFRTTILRGGYDEAIYYPRDQRFRMAYGLYHCRQAYPGDTLDNPEGHTHMVTLFAPTWTWVVGWIRGRKWGFYKLHPTDASEDVWVESEAYGAKGVELKSWLVR